MTFFSVTSRFRPYDYCRITKFMRPDFGVKMFLENLLGELTPPFLVFLDFHFLMEFKPEEDSVDIPLRFQSASKASAINRL